MRLSDLKFISTHPWYEGSLALAKRVLLLSSLLLAATLLEPMALAAQKEGRDKAMGSVSSPKKSESGNSHRIQPVVIGGFEHNQQTYSLNGNWLFLPRDDANVKVPQYPGKGLRRISVPERWEDQGYDDYNGFAWYRLPVRFTMDALNYNLVLDLGRIGDADEVYLDGKLIGKTGSFPPRLNLNKRKERFYPIPPGLIRPDSVQYLTVRVYNYSGSGGFLDGPVRIGQVKHIARSFYLAEGSKLLVAMVIFTVALIVLYFYLQYPQSQESLYLFLAVILYFSYLILNNNMLDVLPNSQLVRLKFSALSLLFFPMAFMAYFVKYFFYNFSFGMRFYLGLTVALFFVILLSGHYRWVLVINDKILPVFFMLPLGYILKILAQNWHKFRLEVRRFLLVIGLNLVAGISDIIKYRGHWPLPEVSPYAVALLIALSAVMIALRFAAKHRYLDKLNMEMENVLTVMNSDFVKRQEQMQIDTHLAQKLKVNVLAQELPSVGGFRYEVFSRPYSSIGEDFVDVSSIYGGRVAISLVDLSAHGVSSSLQAANLSCSLHKMARKRWPVARNFEKLRQLYYEYTPYNPFQAIMVSMNPKEKKIKLINNSPHPVFYYSAKQNRVIAVTTEMDNNDWKALGHHAERPKAVSQRFRNRGYDGQIYEFAEEVLELDIKMAKGDRLLFCSSGVMNAISFSMENFGKSRVGNFLFVTRKLPVRDLGELLFAELEAFLQSRKQLEDWSLVVLEAS